MVLQVDDELKIQERVIERMQENYRLWLSKKLTDVLVELLSTENNFKVFYLKGKIDFIFEQLQSNYEFRVNVTTEHKLENPNIKDDPIFDFGDTD